MYLGKRYMYCNMNVLPNSRKLFFKCTNSNCLIQKFKYVLSNKSHLSILMPKHSHLPILMPKHRCSMLLLVKLHQSTMYQKNAIQLHRYITSIRWRCLSTRGVFPFQFIIWNSKRKGYSSAYNVTDVNNNR